MIPSDVKKAILYALGVRVAFACESEQVTKENFDEILSITEKAAAWLESQPVEQNRMERKLKYRHYKGGVYTLLEIGKLEENGKEVAIYQAFNGEVWVRPLDEFIDKFELIESQPTEQEK